MGGKEVVYPDGSGFVAAEVDTMSIGQCGSNQFCTWSSANYNGSFTYVTGSGVTRTMGWATKSVWNNRTNSARLYNSAGKSSTCYAPGAKQASIGSGYQTPAKVFLSSGASC